MPPNEEKAVGGVAVGVVPTMTTKKSKAVKAALAAFRGLQASEEEAVLRELGLVRVARPEALATGACPLDASAADDLAWVESLIDRDAPPAPTLDQMTAEQRARCNASFRTPNVVTEQSLRKRRASKGQ